MLEAPRLLIGPPAADGSRTIVDAATEQVLGTAEWQGSTGSWWWPRPRILAVHEHVHEDRPLLFTVRRRWNWPPRREVADAEGIPIGELIGDWLRDACSRRRAVRSRQDLETTLIDKDGEPLASYEWVPCGLQFEFVPHMADDPYLKMLLLAAALCDEHVLPDPRNEPRTK